MDTSLSYYILSFEESVTPDINHENNVVTPTDATVPVTSTILSTDSTVNNLSLTDSSITNVTLTDSTVVVQDVTSENMVLNTNDVIQELLSTTGAHDINDQSQKSFQCEICGKSFERILQYYGHLNIHAKDNLWNCGKCPDTQFVTKQQLLKHDIKHNGLVKTYSCLHCPKVFGVPWRLQQHIIGKHTNYNRNHKCNVCGQIFLKPSALKKHESIHSDVRKYPCPHCPARFKDKANAKRHLLKHTNEKPHACAGCGHQYQQLASLSRHRKNCTVKKAQNENMPVPNDIQNQSVCKQNRCRECGVEFQYKSALLEHCVRFHNTSTECNENTEASVDIGKTVDALVEDILSVEDEYLMLNNNETNQNVINDTTNLANINSSQDEKDTDANNADNMHIEFLKDYQLHTLEDELFSNDIDFENFQSSNGFDLNSNNDEYNVMNGNNTGMLFDFPDSSKIIDQDLMNALYNSKVPELTDDLLDIPQDSEKEEAAVITDTKMLSDTAPVTVNDCATIFESDVDLEESSNLAENLNQLIGENNVQYICTEDDDTFIISLNSAIDAEKLSDILNIDVEFAEEHEIASKNMEEESKVDSKKEKSDKKEVKKSRETNGRKMLLFVCKTCKKKFNKKDNYLSHIAIHEPALRRHICDICDMKFSYKSTLNKHTINAHVPRIEPVFTCDTCGRQYKTAWLLKDHGDRDHRGVTPYVCKEEKCQKRFFKKSDLIVHQRCHTGERPYSCQSCDRSFPQKFHLKRHLLSANHAKQMNKILTLPLLDNLAPIEPGSGSRNATRKDEKRKKKKRDQAAKHKMVIVLKGSEV